ncbi:hypothetical protein Acf1_00064 [Acidovorax phage ACF1]|nr:hypothetical protein Acf1_00064 [Acidovorax phage ACF1]
MAVDLVFSQAPLTEPPVNLVFGDDGGAPPIVDAVVSLVTELPGLGGPVRVQVGVTVRLTTVLPGMSGTIGVRYASDTQRPTVNETRTRWQDGRPREDGVASTWEDARRVASGTTGRYQEAQGLRAGASSTWEDAARLRTERAGRYQQAAPLQTQPLTAEYQDARRLRTARQGRYQEAIRTSLSPIFQRYQDALRTARKEAAVRYQDAVRLSQGITEYGSRGDALVKGWRGRYQEAMPPPPGIWVRPGPEPEEPCYVPPPGGAVPLLFVEQWTRSPNLLFVCERHGPGPEPGETVVVPVKEVYLVINSAVLIRVDNGKAIPTLAMSMSLDVDSWTWNFNASVPGRALADLQPEDGAPVDVQATINGVAYRFVVESIGRERSFNQDSLRVGGRGRAAVLDAPYAPVQDFRNNAERSAQQLMADVLTDNGVPLGWDVQWSPTDWQVPAGAFSHQGTYVSALNAIAGSIGAYIQPHNTAEVLRVLSRYPTAPWEWSAVTPDFEIPSAVATRESTDWANKAPYNRVYVTGQGDGIIGRVTRAGTAGDVLAPTVVDPLITDVAAARQRGLSVLADTGRVVMVGLRMPVLAETGIIPPGKYVRYTDGGAERIGITRSVQVDVGLPNIWQTISVESHE